MDGIAGRGNHAACHSRVCLYSCAAAAVLRPSVTIPPVPEPSVATAPSDWNPSTAESVQDANRRPWDFGVPVGGIGTGSFDILPDGRFANFTLPDGRRTPVKDVPGTFVALAAKAISGGGEARILRARIPGERNAIFGERRLIPSATYRGLYPFATVRFDTPAFPLRAALTGYSPFVPGNLFDSSLPAAVVEVEIENPNKFAVSVGVAFSWEDLNSVPDAASAPSTNPTNEMISHSDLDSGRLAGILLSRESQPAGAAGERGNTYYVATDTSGVFITRYLHWDPRGADIPWWRQFERTCRLQPRSKTPPNWQVARSHAGETAAALCVTANLSPGERRTIPFIVAWYKPVVRRDYQDFALTEKLGYGDTFGSTVEVAKYMLRHQGRLLQESREWHELIAQSNLPAWLKSALCNSASRIATGGIVLSGGRYEPFSTGSASTAGDGLRGGGGPLAALFPALHRTQLDLEALAFSGSDDIVSPAGQNAPRAAGDFGVFMAECLRHYRWAGDLPFLRRCYPCMAAALPRSLPSCSPESALSVLATMSVASQAVGDSDAATSFAAQFKVLRDCLSERVRQPASAPTPLCDRITTVSTSNLLAQDFRLRFAGLPSVPLSAAGLDGLAPDPARSIDSAIGLITSGAADKGFRIFEEALGKAPTWGVGRQQGALPSIAQASWCLLPALGGLSFDLPAEILYFDPHLPSALNGELHIPVFTPAFVGWLDYNKSNSAGALTIRKITDPAVSGRFIRRVARNVGEDGKPVGEKALPAPFELREGAVLPILLGI
jgi:hypothetical protein